MTRHGTGVIATAETDRSLLPFFMRKNVGGSNMFGNFWMPMAEPEVVWSRQAI